MENLNKPETLDQLAEYLGEQKDITKIHLIWLADIADSEVAILRREIQSLQEEVSQLKGRKA